MDVVEQEIAIPAHDRDHVDELHRFNAELPYKDSIGAENDRLVADITHSLNYFNAEVGDPLQVLRACSGLERLRHLKYNLDDDVRLQLAQCLSTLAFPTSGASLPWRCGDKVMSSLTNLIGRKKGRLALVGRLVLPWRPMLAAVEKFSVKGFPEGSGRNERSRLSTLLYLTGEARQYWAPGADREIWDEVKEEITQVQTQSAFKALFILCLFLPSRTSLYEELLPEWFSLWGQIDHCPSWDGGWLTLICRSRKHAPSSFDWTPYMPDIFSLARKSINTPITLGDAGSTQIPASRPVAYQYQAIGPRASVSGGAKLAKLGKMLVFLLGKGGPPEPVQMADLAIIPPTGGELDGAYGEDGRGEKRVVSPGARGLLSVFLSVRTYVHPSNGGRWAVEIALMMSSTLNSLAARVGEETMLREIGRVPPNGELTRDDARVVVDALLPLVLEMVYSKNPSVSAVSNVCLSSLAALSPQTVAPAAAELILRALDPVASINHTHQAPAAIRALTAVFRPLMYPRPYLAPYVPALVELSLPGIDANDVLKTSVTLQLYHLILCWLPVQSNAVRYPTGSLDSWKPPQRAWLDGGSTDEAQDAEEADRIYTACESLGGVMMEWSVALLDRLFEVLRHKDKSSKVKVGGLASDTMNVAAAMTGLSGGGMGMLSSMLGGGGHESFLVGLISVVMRQLFMMMDEPAAEVASGKVLRFVTDRPLPNVEKDVAAIVTVIARARPARTVATFLPALCDGLLANSDPPALTPGTSPGILRWRLRLLSGLARGAKLAMAPHGSILRRLIAAGIKHSDKSVRKSARKLLRKALEGLCEITLADTRSLPPARWANADSVLEWRRLCEPVSTNEQDTTWVEPSPEALALAAGLLEEFFVQPMQLLSLELSRERGEGDDDAATASSAVGVWRENLKTMDYALRGGVALLSDRDIPGEDDEASSEHLRDDNYISVGSRGLSRLLSAAGGVEGPKLYGMVAGLRANATRFLIVALEACAKGNGPNDVKAAKLAIQLSRRISCTRGAKAHETRRHVLALAAFKSQQRDVVSTAQWKARFNLALEAAMCRDTAAVAEARRGLNSGGLGKKSFPRALFLARVFLQHWKRVAAVPRAIAFATKEAARSPNDASDAMETRGADRVPWPAASAVLHRYHSLFIALVRLSSSEYAMVRAAAQVGVSRVGGVYPWFTREAVHDLIGRVSPSDKAGSQDGMEGEDGDAAHRRLTGTCYLLHQKRNMKHVASNWSLMRALLLALCDSQAVLARLPADKQEKAAARVTILFNDYVSTWRSNLLITDKDKSEHNALMNGLLERLAAFSDAAPSAGGGWRYQLMASWCLMHLIRPPETCAESFPSSTSIITRASLTSPPPLSVWRWFAGCLSAGDRQPLQRLALGALKRLLLSADPTSTGGGEVSALLCSKEFLHALVLALAYNHKEQATEGGSAGAEQWSLGVRNVLNDSFRGGSRELFPRLRFSMRSPLFRVRNARLVSAVVSAVAEENRDECVRILVEEATAAKASAAHEDKRSFDCAAAEVGAGIIAVLSGENCWAGGGLLLRETVLPFVEKELEGGSLDGRLDWTDAICFALDRSVLEGAEPLVSTIVERTMTVLQGGGKGRDDFSVLVKWLSFTGAVLIVLSARAASAARAETIARELCPLLVEGLDHPFNACREEIARNLFLVCNAADVAWAVNVANSVRRSIMSEAAAVEGEYGQPSGTREQEVQKGIATLSVKDAIDTVEDADSALVASAMVMSDGAPTKEQEKTDAKAAKRLSLRRETVLQWLYQTTGAGDQVKYLPIVVALLPVALHCVRDSKIEVAAMGRGACLSIAASLTARSSKAAADDGMTNAADTDPGTMDGVLSAVLSAASSQSSWRVRRNAAAIACVLQTRLHFVLNPTQHRATDAMLLSLLGDARREVQETARLAMSTRVAHLAAAEVRVLSEKFAAGADSAAASRKKRRKLAKQKAAAGGAATTLEEASGALTQQQTSVLGLSAVVLAAPCDVPPWVPSALESLARHVNDESPGRLPVRQTVTHTFKEFRRTHQDKWEESHKARFSRDQLDIFDDVLGGAHSYFV